MSRRRWVVVLCGVAIVAAVAALGYGRTAAYPHPESFDEHYDFSRAHALRRSVAVRDGRLTLVPKAGERDALFLRLRVHATLTGHWFDPQLRVVGGDAVLSQGFAPGSAGVRYLNLSGLSPSHATDLRLQGIHLRVPDQDAILYDLPSDVDPAHQRILLLSPHPDDVTIAAYGLYAHRDAYVVTVTAGEAGDPGVFSMFGGRLASLEKGRMRVWDSLVVPLLNGLSSERTANLGYFDGTLAAMQAGPLVAVRSQTSGAATLDIFRRSLTGDLLPPAPRGAPTMDDLIQDLAYLVQHVQPDLIVTPYPIIDAHPDHKLVTVALIEALQRLDWHRGALLLYSNHLPATQMYPYGGRGDVTSLPPLAHGVLFDDIVSSPLGVNERRLKFLALDAMSDLRMRYSYYSSPPSFRRAMRPLLHALKVTLTGSDTSYYRRALHANELFFEVHVASLYEPGVVAQIEGRTAPGNPAVAAR